VKAKELFAGLRQADYRHDGGIRCLPRLRLTPDYFARLISDVERLCRTEQGSDVTHPGHVTHWTRPRGMVRQFSLLNTTGRYDDYSTDHDLSCLGKSFHGHAAYPSLRNSSRHFRTPSISVSMSWAPVPVGPHVKLPPMVTPADLTRLGWCDVQ
jgi:hypothetical protein